MADKPVYDYSVYIPSSPPNTYTTANFSSEASGVIFDPTSDSVQTVGLNVGTWNVTSATGSSHDDEFFFEDLSAGDSFTINGGAGKDIIFLEHYTADEVSLDASTLTIDTGHSTTATINLSNIEVIKFDSNIFDGNPHELEIVTNFNRWDADGTSFSSEDVGSSVALIRYNGSLASNFTLNTTVTARPGSYLNGAIIFDYTDALNYKYAIARYGDKKWRIEELVSGSQNVRSQSAGIPTLIVNTAQTIELRVTGQVASIYSNNVLQTSYDFGEALNDGEIGILAKSSNTDFEIQLSPSNWAPSVPILIDSMRADENQFISPDLIARSMDNESESLTLSITNQPANGTSVITANNTITYTPNAMFRGKEEITYNISDGTNTVEGVILLDVLDSKLVAPNDGDAYKLDLDITAVDNDGSETTTVILRSLPSGTTVTDGTTTITATASDTDISSLDLTAVLTIDPPLVAQSSYTVTVIVENTESSNLESNSVSIDYTVDVQTVSL